MSEVSLCVCVCLSYLSSPCSVVVVRLRVGLQVGGGGPCGGEHLGEPGGEGHVAEVGGERLHLAHHLVGQVAVGAPAKFEGEEKEEKWGVSFLW